MTVEELRAEADKMGYMISRKPERVPHGKCECGGLGRAKHHFVGSQLWAFIVCDECGAKTRDYDRDSRAWKAWNKMMGYNKEEKDD